jgi:hypothetical protein
MVVVVLLVLVLPACQRGAFTACVGMMRLGKKRLA